MSSEHRTIISGDGTPLAATHHPAPAGAPGVVVVHGLASTRRNHEDFCERCARAGMAAVSVDLRGHGESPGEFGPGALDDVLAACAWLAARGHPQLGVRGSSLGGFLGLHAAARDPRLRAVVAICPARPEALARRTGRDWPLALPLEPTLARPGVARGFWHAVGDEVVPWGTTYGLFQRAPHPRQLRVEMRGSHRSLQHDPAVQAQTVAFLLRHLTA